MSTSIRPDSAQVFKAVLPLMSRHAPDFLPKTYATWFAFATGDPGVRGALGPLLADGRRVSADAISAVHDRFVAGARERALARAQEGIATLLSRVEESVHASRSGAQALLDEIAALEDCLSPAERERLAAQLARLGEAGSSVRDALDQAAAKLATAEAREARPGVSGDGPDPQATSCVPPPAPGCDPAADAGGFEFVFDFGAPPSDAADPPATPAAGPRDESAPAEMRAFRHALHQACARAEAGRASGVVLVALDPPRRSDGRPAPLRAAAWIPALAGMVRTLAPGALLAANDDDHLLLLLDDADADAALAIATRVCAGVPGLAPPAGTDVQSLTASAAATVVGADDLPEGVLGRLNRGLVRVQMQGGNRAERMR